MAEVKVYTKNNCVQCKMTKKFLDQAGIGYEEFNIEEEPQYAQELKDAGFRQAPVVMVPGMDSFSGFRPDQLKQISQITA
ncbi:glutaredoxin-like protein NrdH [Eupransor demetentiae]|uniref:Glutaredoxin-like protein NrdH n=1 Tax=Eupransor demetentiae TaxID=3109584 RepID=A0ABP0ETL9_9LACO|nr:Glutaredoxin (GrxC) [Lactobacillaceae bacterium LMG 33000]